MRRTVLLLALYVSTALTHNGLGRLVWRPRLDDDEWKRVAEENDDDDDEKKDAGAWFFAALQFDASLM